MSDEVSQSFADTVIEMLKYYLPKKLDRATKECEYILAIKFH